MALNYFTYNNQASKDYGLLVTALKVFGAPSRNVDKYSVPGRNGDILVDLGSYSNYVVQYQVAIIDNFKVNARDIANWLLSGVGYSRLEDTYNPESYRLASLYSEVEYITTALNREGQATIEFDCKPQRFLLTGETSTSITGNDTITNPTQMASKPLLRAYGTGTLSINGQDIVIRTVDSYVDIDCEAQQCYKGAVNCNNDVEVDEFPTFIPGVNVIELDGITRVDITPRWWEL